MSSDQPPIEGTYTVVGEANRPLRRGREPIIKSWKGLMFFLLYFLMLMGAGRVAHR